MLFYIFILEYENFLFASRFLFNLVDIKGKQLQNELEMPGIEPGAFHMQSERATTALHPPHIFQFNLYN